MAIALFGLFEVRVNGRPLPRLRSRKGLSLLALLALRHGGEVERGWVAGLLWPDCSASEGLATLRRNLTDLRQALGAEAARLRSPTPRTLSLDLTGAAVDVAAFDHVMEHASPSCLEEAVALYRGPLLEGWLEEWVFQERHSREQAYLAALETLAAHAQANGDSAAAERYLRQAVSAEPLRETTQRELMRLLASGGNYAAAVLVYQELRRRLHRELNAEPDPGTTALFQQLRAEARQRLRSLPEPEPDENTLLLPEPTRIALLHRLHAQPDEDLLEALEPRLGARGYQVFANRQTSASLDWARERERQLLAVDVVIPFLSEASVQSELLAEELQRAHAAAQRHGKPRLLPVWIGDAGLLPEPLSAIIDPREGAVWTGPRDNERLADALHRALQYPTAPFREADGALPRDVIQVSTPTGDEEPAGGAVPLGSPYYVTRPADGELSEALARRDGIVLIKGARQMGKTSLLARGLHQAREAGARVALTDFQKLNAANLDSAESLLISLAQWIAVQLDLSVMPQDVWNSRCSPNLNFELYLRRQVLATCASPVVWGLDEVDRLFPCGCGSEVFGLFRSWHNERILDPASPWSRLTLVITYATEAHLFITDLNQSPFNVGTRLCLEAFTPEQVADLNRRCGSPLRNEAEIAGFYCLLGGQPYLVRRGLREMRTHGHDMADVEAQADQDQGIFGDHLRRMLLSLASAPELCEAMRQVLRGSPCPTADSFYRLRSAGLLAGESARDVRPRCQLYTTFLQRHLL